MTFFSSPEVLEAEKIKRKREVVVKIYWRITAFLFVFSAAVEKERQEREKKK